jgi:hypothetical protein
VQIFAQGTYQFHTDFRVLAQKLKEDASGDAGKLYVRVGLGRYFVFRSRERLVQTENSSLGHQAGNQKRRHGELNPHVPGIYEDDTVGRTTALKN